MTLCMPNSNCSVCTKCCNTLFPFFTVSDVESKMLNFFSMFKSVNNSNDTNITYDEYFCSSRLSKTTANLQRNDFLLVHLNTRSFSKNLDKIEEFLNDMTRFPDAIAISETKLNSNSSSNNNIPHYNFLHNDSPTNAGGVAFYIKDTSQFPLRDDLSLNLPNCEYIWIQIKCKMSNIIYYGNFLLT